MKKILVLVLFFLTFTLISCDRKEKIRFLNFKPEVANEFKELSKKYKKETGVTLVVETAASGSYEETLRARISTKEAPTIFICNGPVGYQRWKNYCADLKDSKLYELLSDKNHVIKNQDNIYGIALTLEGYGIIYNNELCNKYFNLANRQNEINSMEEINSFAKLETVVKDMDKFKSELGIKGVFGATSLKPGEDWRYHTHTFDVPLVYELGNYVEKTPNEINFNYSDNYKNIIDLYMNYSTVDKAILGTKVVEDSMIEFALEECVMIQNGNWSESTITSYKDSKVNKDDLRFLPIYTGANGEEKQGLCIGTENYLCINSKASKKEQKMALDFLEWLFTSETGKDFVINKLGFIPPFSSFDLADVAGTKLSQEVLKWLNKDEIENLNWVTNIIPSHTFKEKLGANLLRYAQGKIKWDELVLDTKKDWKEEASKL